MNIRRLLVHRCSVIHQGTVIGQDDYGQDIYGELIEANIPCYVDRLRQSISTGDTGDDIIQRNNLFLPSDLEVSMTMKIQDIIDEHGKEVLLGSFTTEQVNPFYTKRGLSHFELTIRKE